MNAVSLYGVYARASVKMQMAYPWSFLVLSFAQFAITTIEFFGLYLLFARFGSLDGWTLGEVALFYGVVSITFAIADTVTRGFDVFGAEFIKTGNFDRILLRPRAAWLQILGFELRLTRVGRFIQGVAVLLIGASLLHLAWKPLACAQLLFAIAGGTALFSGLFVLQATMSFWTVESLEILNTLTYGGVEASQVPLSIYARWLQRFLTFVVPLACVTYFPILAVLGKAEKAGMSAEAATLMPAFGLLFLVVSLFVWGFGVSHYRSTGS